MSIKEYLLKFREYAAKAIKKLNEEYYTPEELNLMILECLENGDVNRAMHLAIENGETLEAAKSLVKHFYIDNPGSCPPQLKAKIFPRIEPQAVQEVIESESFVMTQTESEEEKPSTTEEALGIALELLLQHRVVNRTQILKDILRLNGKAYQKAGGVKFVDEFIAKYKR